MVIRLESDERIGEACSRNFSSIHCWPAKKFRALSFIQKYVATMKLIFFKIFARKIHLHHIR